MSPLRCLLVLVLAAGCQRSTEDARTPAPTQPLATPGSPTPATPPVRPTEYMGRTIAPTMSHLGADWLTRSNRDEEEQPEAMLDELGLAPGKTACDVGAGNGFHAIRMAKRVAPSGKVLAADLQPKMLELLRTRAAEAGVTNIETIVAEETDPKLPPGSCDVIILVDVYHELSDPAETLAHLSRALAPTGRIALVEFRGEDPDVPIKPEHKMTKAQILAEYQANGLELVGSHDGLPWQHLMFFRPQQR